MMDAPGPKGTLTEWLDYIESIHPEQIDMGLARVQSIGQALGVLTRWPCPIVMVAGTNGKGTTVKTVSALLTSLGYTTGTYLSPHLMHFSERIEVNSQPVSDKELVEAFCNVEYSRVLLKQTLSYFEFTTLAALWIFKHKPLDVLILEVGLGGRLDAVNIVDPDISIITSIGLDHMEYLGDTLDKIATEKAGIIRKDRPVLIGRDAYRDVLIDIAKAKQAKIYVRGRDFDDEILLSDEESRLLRLFPDSVQLAVQTLKLLMPTLGISIASLKYLWNHFPAVSVMGRFQSLMLHEVEWIIDVAHNAHAATWLAENINQLSSTQATHIVWCSFADKDIAGILNAVMDKLSPQIQHTTFWYMGALKHARSATHQQLNLLAQPKELAAMHLFATFEEALNQAYNQARSGDRIIVFGSFQAANEAFAFIKKKGEN